MYSFQYNKFMREYSILKYMRAHKKIDLLINIFTSLGKKSFSQSFSAIAIERRFPKHYKR